MSDELPPPPPGITLMSLQEFLGRRESATNAAPQVSSRMQTPGDQSAPGKRPAVAAPPETPRTEAAIATWHRDPLGVQRDKAEDYARQLERERNAWEAKFNAECEKHDATTLRAMKAERDLALALDHIEKDDKEIERLHNEIDALRSNPSARPEAAPADFLTERIAWLKREWEAGGNYEHLNTRRKEAIYIAEKLGVKWMLSRSDRKP